MMSPLFYPHTCCDCGGADASPDPSAARGVGGAHPDAPGAAAEAAQDCGGGRLGRPKDDDGEPMNSERP